MNNNTKTAGVLFVTSAIALLIPYSILAMTFDYPGILRENTADILTRFHEGDSSIVWTWFAFALTGLPLIPAYILIGQEYGQKTGLVRMATTIGLIGLIVQVVGLLRWTFVVPVLAETFVNATDESTKAAAIVAFKTIHQFGGVLLGEHLGQLFTIAWTVMITLSFGRMKAMPKWVNVLGWASSLIYLLAQAELLGTVMKGILVWDMAGFLGSTLWLIWLIIVGIMLMRTKRSDI